MIPEKQLRETDIIVPWYSGQAYELYDDKPLTSRVWVAPLRVGHAEVPYIDDIDDAAKGQTAIVVRAKNLTYPGPVLQHQREVARDGLDFDIEGGRGAGRA